MESKLEKGIFAVLEYIVAIFMVLECRSVYLYSIGREFYIMQILGISMIVLFFANLVSKKIKWQNITLNYKFILALTVYNFIFAIVHKMMGSEYLKYIKRGENNEYDSPATEGTEGRKLFVAAICGQNDGCGSLYVCPL